MLKYHKPFVTDLGSISEHTWTTPGGRIKGGGAIFHLDKFCEPSGCSSANDPDCINLCEETAGTESTGTRTRTPKSER